MPDTATLATVFDAAIKPLQDADVFAGVTRTDQGVRCDAMHLEEECYDAAHTDSDGTLWVGWYSPDRWVSGSIEGDLVHTGDKIDELLEEELVDLGLSIKLPLEHYRNSSSMASSTCPAIKPRQPTRSSKCCSRFKPASSN